MDNEKFLLLEKLISKILPEVLIALDLATQMYSTGEICIFLSEQQTLVTKCFLEHDDDVHVDLKLISLYYMLL